MNFKIFLKKNWFMLGLVIITLATVLDSSGLFTSPGVWLKKHHGPDFVIVLIFFLSGMALDASHIRDGLADIKGTLAALFLIFLVAPVFAFLLSYANLPIGIMLGLYLVAAMPTTLSSGVVMTGSSGGNMAHALLITIIANGLAVLSIPVVLGFLLGHMGDNRPIEIDQLPMMIKIATLVLLPLTIGILTRNTLRERLRPFLPHTSTCNQIGILTMVWMALCTGRDAIITGLDNIVPVAVTASIFHLLLVFAGFILTTALYIPKRRRESVILMGGQKTLPLSVILQVSLFPEYGIALVVCVLHHIIHLIMDAFLVRYLKEKK